MRVLLTGSAGFIGFHLARRLLTDGHEVTGYDGMTPYYDVGLKRSRHALLAQFAGFRAIEAMLEDGAAVDRAFAESRPELVVHLGAQAGVRYGIENPKSYLDANLAGTFNVLEAARDHAPEHLLIASSSSVYGATTAPSREGDATDRPLSLYAATKKAGEVMSHSYAHLFGLPVTCLRFFTVYGPWGRPDMALFKFVSAIEAGTPIELYGEGQMRRDFTFVDDAVEALCRLIERVPQAGMLEAPGDSISAVAPWRAVNVAGGRPVPLSRFVTAIETALGRNAIKRLLPMQPGDVTDTAADVSLLMALAGEVPGTSIEDGVSEFVAWHRRHVAA